MKIYTDFAQSQIFCTTTDLTMWPFT